MRLSGKELQRREDVAQILGELSQVDVDTTTRASLLGRLAALLVDGARAAGAHAVVTGRWLADVVADTAPHVPVRDLVTLRQHYAGLSGDELAQALIDNAAKTTAAVGAAGGALAAVQFAAPPTLLAAPVQLAAETLTVVAVELKLVAELHVVYGQAPRGDRSQVAAAYLSAWLRRKAADPTATVPGVGSLVTAAFRRELSRRVAKRAARNVSTMVPFLAGAVAGATLNRRETRGLGEKVQRDVRALARSGR